MKSAAKIVITPMLEKPCVFSGVRLSEHQAEVEKATNKKCTRSERRATELEQTKSAISDHVVRANHVIDWMKPRS